MTTVAIYVGPPWVCGDRFCDDPVLHQSDPVAMSAVALHVTMLCGSQCPCDPYCGPVQWHMAAPVCCVPHMWLYDII